MRHKKLYRRLALVVSIMLLILVANLPIKADVFRAICILIPGMATIILLLKEL